MRILAVFLVAACVAVPLSGCGHSQDAQDEGAAGPPRTIQIDAPGGADHQVLSDALAEVAEGGTVELAAGTYDLGAERLLIDRPVRLVGTGAQTTKIVGAAREAVVRVTGSGTFAAEGITFARQKGTRGCVVSVDVAEVRLTGCRFAGGSHTRDWSYAALWIKGETGGAVRRCVASDGDTGIDVSGSATVAVEGNVCSGNRSCGIASYESARPLIRDNTCSKNGSIGIYAYDLAQPTIEANECSGCRYGIAVQGEAQATVASNLCRGNKLSGVAVYATARCTVSDNVCAGNLDGIALSGEVEASVSRNTCTGNRDTGIYIGDRATAVITANLCDRNGRRHTGGICVTGHGRATVTDNSCLKNASYGILFRDSAAGSATGNRCKGGRYGIVVNDRARPRLSGNECTGNRVKGVEIYRGG